MSDQTYRASSPAFDVIVKYNVMILVRDGTRLATNLYFPARSGKIAGDAFPVVIERTPYSKDRMRSHAFGMFMARRGYVCAIQDVRGRFKSEGEFDLTHFRPQHEGPDYYDVITWLGEQPWCSGKVGTYGLSYSGQNQQAAAILNPPYLASQFIMDCGLNYWRKPIRTNGAFTQGILLPYAFRMAMEGREARQAPTVARALRQTHANLKDLLPRLPLKAGTTSLALTPDYERWYLSMATEDRYGAFWSDPSSSQEEHLDAWKDVPVCFVTGWYGQHLAANFEKYELLRQRFKSPVKLIVGPWTHVEMLDTTYAGDVDFGLEAYLGTFDTALRWFDETLRGLDTGMTSGPGILYLTMGGGDGRRNDEGRLHHGGTWNASDEWPPPGASLTPYYLQAGGTLSPTPPEEAEARTTYTYDPRDPVPTIGGGFQNPGIPGLGDGGAFDQRGNPARFATSRDTLPLSTRHDVLVFQTPPLPEAVEVTGPIVVKLWVSSSAVDTDFTVKLIDVYPPSPDDPEGFAMNLQDAVMRMRYRDGTDAPALMKPGEVYEIEIALHSVSNLFAKGHRIRLDISSSNFPFYDVNTNTGEALGVHGTVQVAHNTVYHDAKRPSHIVLPVVKRG